MRTLTLSTPIEQTDWFVMSEAVVQVSDLGSLDELLLRALNHWIKELSPELRWQVALRLYQGEHISSGRAAEIAGLNYFVFLDRLEVAFLGGESQTEAEQQESLGLIHELIDLPQA